MKTTLRGIALVMWIGVAPVALSEDLASVIQASFSDSGQATLLRLEQDSLQQRCSQSRDNPVDATVAMALRQERLDAVVFPADGEFLGDWQRGAAVAASGRGLQSNDDPSIANGGNCYACHQLAPTEVAYGTLGPSLTQYGLRGQSDAMLRYTWTKLWDTHAFNLCSHMPRFGAQKILTEQQLKDVMAFLLDPNSSVNQPAEGPSSAH
jgi:sulfur-oxidizing protein SoxX